MKKKKRGRIIRLAVLLFLLTAVGVLAYLYTIGAFEPPKPPAKPKKIVKPLPPPPPPTYPCPLCGKELLEEALTTRRPLLVKVENAPEARPQSGLDKADIVYEVVAEGNITRFAAIYQCGEADSIGPVRSARFADAILVPQYDALFAHCGGAYFVLSEIRAAGIDDLDEMRYGREGYWRTKDRKMPHNLYTSTKMLRSLSDKKGFNREAYLEGFTFKEKAETTGYPIQSVTIPFASWNRVVYQYDKNTNSWLRFHNKVPHKDGYTGKQITVKNLVVMYTKMIVTSFREDRLGSPSLKFGLDESGRAEFYVDGKAIIGTWSAGPKKMPAFYAEDGSRIELNPGNVWIEVVPASVKTEVVKPAIPTATAPSEKKK